MAAAGRAKRPRGGGRQLEAGMRGILITCNMNERKCVGEAYSLLGEYGDLLYGPEQVRACGPGRSLGAGRERGPPQVLPPAPRSLAALTPAGRGEQRREASSPVLFVKNTCLCSPHGRRCRFL